MYPFKEHLVFFQKRNVFSHLNFLHLFLLSLSCSSVQILFVLSLSLLIAFLHISGGSWLSIHISEREV